MCIRDSTHTHTHTHTLLSQLQRIINIDTQNSSIFSIATDHQHRYQKFFYNTHIKPHIDYVSVARDGCSEVHFKKLNSLHRRAGKLIFVILSYLKSKNKSTWYFKPINIFLRLTFRQTWMDLFESRLPKKVSVVYVHVCPWICFNSHVLHICRSSV